MAPSIRDDYNLEYNYSHKPIRGITATLISSLIKSGRGARRTPIGNYARLTVVIVSLSPTPQDNPISEAWCVRIHYHLTKKKNYVGSLCNVLNLFGAIEFDFLIVTEGKIVIGSASR